MTIVRKVQLCSSLLSLKQTLHNMPGTFVRETELWSLEQTATRGERFPERFRLIVSKLGTLCWPKCLPLIWLNMHCLSFPVLHSVLPPEFESFYG